MTKCPPSRQQARSFRRRVTLTVGYRYLMYEPAGYARSRGRWPLLLFLHGAGERGDDLELVKKHGPPQFLDGRPDFPFLVASPQCPADDWWSTDTLGALLDVVTAKYRVDLRRVCVTGLSMGGYGTWALAVAQPRRFAAIAPICGGGNPLLVRRIKKLPVWAFHGARDAVVALERSQQMVNALRTCEGNVRLTIYPEADHDSWTETYENPELYTWLLAQRRRGR